MCISRIQTLHCTSSCSRSDAIFQVYCSVGFDAHGILFDLDRNQEHDKPKLIFPSVSRTFTSETFHKYSMRHEPFLSFLRAEVSQKHLQGPTTMRSVPRCRIHFGETRKRYLLALPRVPQSRTSSIKRSPYLIRRVILLSFVLLQTRMRQNLPLPEYVKPPPRTTGTFVNAVALDGVMIYATR